MTRNQLEHILRAAGAITDEREIVVLGSQAILGSYPDVPAKLCASMEADVFPAQAPEKADLIDGTIGELSPFHDTHGYYAHGITPESITLADGWQKRLVRIQSQVAEGVIGLCLSPADLSVSKLAAGRNKDMTFVALLVRHRLVLPDAIATVAAAVAEPARATVLENLRLCLAQAEARHCSCKP